MITSCKSYIKPHWRGSAKQKHQQTNWESFCFLSFLAAFRSVLQGLSCPFWMTFSLSVLQVLPRLTRGWRLRLAQEDVLRKALLLKLLQFTRQSPQSPQSPHRKLLDVVRFLVRVSSCFLQYITFWFTPQTVFLILMYDVFIKLVGPENFSRPEGSKGLQRAQEMSTNPQTAHPLRCTHNLNSSK